MTSTDPGPDPHPGGAGLDAIADAVAVLRVDVDDLTDALTELNSQDPPAAGPSRWSWRHADAGTAAALWLELIDWVNWIVPRYELTGEAATIPPCWYRHPVAVEELTALMAAWQAAYHGRPQTPRDDLITWHDRWFWPSIDRLQTRAGWRSCIDGNSHQERKLRRWAPDPHMTSFVAQGPGPPHDPTV